MFSSRVRSTIRSMCCRSALLCFPNVFVFLQVLIVTILIRIYHRLIHELRPPQGRMLQYYIILGLTPRIGVVSVRTTWQNRYLHYWWFSETIIFIAKHARYQNFLKWSTQSSARKMIYFELTVLLFELNTRSDFNLSVNILLKFNLKKSQWATHSKNVDDCVLCKTYVEDKVKNPMTRVIFRSFDLIFVDWAVCRH